MTNSVVVMNLSKKFKKFQPEAKKIILKALKILKKKNLEVEIYLADNQTMRRLNREFRGKDKTTTVLSFEEPRNFISPPSKFRKIGEIYINNQQPTTNNKQQTILLIHGLLHLLGYDHKKKNDRIKMEKLEQYVYNSS